MSNEAIASAELAWTYPICAVCGAPILTWREHYEIVEAIDTKTAKLAVTTAAKEEACDLLDIYTQHGLSTPAIARRTRELRAVGKEP